MNLNKYACDLSEEIRTLECIIIRNSAISKEEEDKDIEMEELEHKERIKKINELWDELADYNTEIR